jgi:hypothetical protein
MATSEANNLDHHYDSKYKRHCSTCREFNLAEENGKSITEASRDYHHPFAKIRSSLPKPKSKSKGGKRRRTFRRTKTKTRRTRRTRMH